MFNRTLRDKSLEAGRENAAASVDRDPKLAGMRKAGLVVWEAHQVAAEMVAPGVATQDIDAAVDQFLQSRDAVPLFKGVPNEKGGPFPASTCVSVNAAVVHGIPGAYRLKEGDVVSVDIGAKVEGWCGDAAVTYPVGQIHPRAQKLLEVTEATLALAIQLLTKKKQWLQIARELQKFVQRSGFSVVEGLVGHSIGSEMWEGLQLPNYYSKDFDNLDFHIVPGLVVAIEPMINMGAKEVEVLDDCWTIVAKDGLPSAHFEHTIAVTKHGPYVLTAGPDGAGWGIPGR